MLCKGLGYLVCLLQDLVPVCKTAKAVAAWPSKSHCALLGELDLRSMAECGGPVES